MVDGVGPTIVFGAAEEDDVPRLSTCARRGVCGRVYVWMVVVVGVGGLVCDATGVKGGANTLGRAATGRGTGKTGQEAEPEESWQPAEEGYPC